MRKRKTRGQGGKTGKAQAGFETGKETGSEAGKARKTGREADTETGSWGSVRANQSVCLARWCVHHQPFEAH